MQPRRLDDWTPDDVAAVCPSELAALGASWTDDLTTGIREACVVQTDGAGRHAAALVPDQVTADLMTLARRGAVLNPCPPFTRGLEVSAGVVASGGPFVGYRFKAALLPVQQAVMA